MLKLDHYANLCHYFISIAGIGTGSVDATRAGGVSLFVFLFPNIEVYTMRRIIWLPLRATILRLFALGKIPNIQILIKLIPFSYWYPR